MKDKLDAMKQQMHSIFGVIGIINSEEEKQSVVKHLINSGVYKVKV
jgi:hypothetical protein